MRFPDSKNNIVLVETQVGLSSLPKHLTSHVSTPARFVPVQNQNKSTLAIPVHSEPKSALSIKFRTGVEHQHLRPL